MPSIATLIPTTSNPHTNIADMLSTSVIALALSTMGLTQVVVPAGYNKVYLQSMVDTKYVVQAKATTTGSTIVV